MPPIVQPLLFLFASLKIRSEDARKPLSEVTIGEVNPSHAARA